MTRWLGFLLLVCLCLAACGAGGSSASTVVGPAPSAHLPPIAGDPEPQSAKPSGGQGLVLVDVRAAAHEGFDRIVLEFRGKATPGWWVGYVDEAVLEGSGKVVRLGGDAILNIGAIGTTWPAPGYYSGPRRFEPADGGDIVEVYIGGTWEGYTQVFAGLDGDAVPFRAFALAKPARLVIDVGPSR